MKHYEMFCVLPGTLGEDEVTTVIENISQVLGNNNASEVTREDMGKSRLAYPIKHIRYGYFQLFRFDIEPKDLAKLENDTRLLENILRVMIHVSDPKKEKAYVLAQDPTALSAPQKSDKDSGRNKKKSFNKKDSKDLPTEEKESETKSDEKDSAKENIEVKEEKEQEDVEKEVKKESTKTKTKEDKPKISIDDIDQKLDEILQKDIDKV